MNCRRVEKLLIEDSASGALSQLREHMAQCDSCRELHEELLAIEELSSNLSSGQGAPECFSSTVFEQTLHSHPSRGYPLRLMVVGAFSAVLAAGLAWQSGVGIGGGAGKGALAEGAAATPVSFEQLRVVRHVDHIEPEFVDVILDRPGSSPYLLRLPAKIEIRHDELPRERQVSYATY